MTENKSINEQKENESTENNKETESKQDMSRRTFIKNSGIAAGGVVGGALLGGYFGNPFKTEQALVPEQPTEKKDVIDYSETRQFFKRKEDFDVLSVATERIYPEDEHGPGAIGLGVPYFIDKQLMTGWGRNINDYMSKPFVTPEQSPLTRQEVLLQGVRKLNEVSHKELNNAFYNVDEDQQIEILERFATGEIEMKYVSSAQFFGLLRQTTLEGCYSDPMYGGNKNMEGWRMKEYPGPRIAYIDVVEDDFVLFEPVSLKNQS